MKSYLKSTRNHTAKHVLSLTPNPKGTGHNYSCYIKRIDNDIHILTFDTNAIKLDEVDKNNNCQLPEYSLVFLIMPKVFFLFLDNYLSNLPVLVNFCRAKLQDKALLIFVSLK
jgi:hypothetical protein